MDDPNKSLEVILKNIVNETYATDISKKVSSSHQMRIKQGGFICGAAPYGYVARKDEDGIRRLYPDENTAPIVKEIFDAYLARRLSILKEYLALLHTPLREAAASLQVKAMIQPLIND